MLNFISGGFMSGYRTYLLGGLIALQALVGWAIGDTTLAELVTQLPEILGGLGLMTLRAAKSA